MRAVVILNPGPDAKLALEVRPDPIAGRGQVVIRTAFVGVNRADVIQVSGRYPAPPGVVPDVPGLEYAGIVEEVASDVTSLEPGDRVYGLVGGGAYAERIVTDALEVARLPDEVDLSVAAAVPEAYVTAYDALLVRGALSPGERVLIHAVGSSVGIAALQIAKGLGCTVIGTSRTESKLERAEALGLDRSIVVDGPPESALAGLTDVDVVLDLVGGPYVSASLATLAPKGRIVVVGLLAGRKAELDLGLLLRGRAQITGTVLRSRPLFERIAAAELLRRTLSPWLSQGKLRPIIHATVPFEEAAAAHRLLAANEPFGKVLLGPFSP